MSGMIAFESMLHDISDTFDQEFRDDEWVAYVDDVNKDGVFVAGEGMCGRIPVDTLHIACRRASKRGKDILVETIERYVG